MTGIYTTNMLLLTSFLASDPLSILVGCLDNTPAAFLVAPMQQESQQWHKINNNWMAINSNINMLLSTEIDKHIQVHILCHIMHTHTHTHAFTWKREQVLNLDLYHTYMSVY